MRAAGAAEREEHSRRQWVQSPALSLPRGEREGNRIGGEGAGCRPWIMARALSVAFRIVALAGRMENRDAGAVAKLWEACRQRLRSLTATRYASPSAENNPEEAHGWGGAAARSADVSPAERVQPEVLLAYGTTMLIMSGVWFYYRRRMGLAERRYLDALVEQELQRRKAQGLWVPGAETMGRRPTDAQRMVSDEGAAARSEVKESVEVREGGGIASSTATPTPTPVEAAERMATTAGAKPIREKTVGKKKRVTKSDVDAAAALDRTAAAPSKRRAPSQRRTDAASAATATQSRQSRSRAAPKPQAAAVTSSAAAADTKTAPATRTRKPR